MNPDQLLATRPDWTPPSLPLPQDVTAEALWLQYRETAQMLAAAHRRHAIASREREEASDLVQALAMEKARLLGEIEAAVEREAGATEPLLASSKSHPGP